MVLECLNGKYWIHISWMYDSVIQENKGSYFI